MTTITMRYIESLHRLVFHAVDWFLMRRCLLTGVVLATVLSVGAYVVRCQHQRAEHIPTYLLFGVATVLGFFISHRVLQYVRPVTGMEEYVDYLTEVLQKTMPGERLVILAATPNPGLAEYLSDRAKII